MNTTSYNNLILPKYLILVKQKGSKNLLRAYGKGGANTTLLFSAAHFAKRNTKFGGGGKIGIGKRGQAKIPSPQPPSFLPAGKT